LAVLGGGHLLELAEEASEVVAGNANAGVAHSDFYVIAEYLVGKGNTTRVGKLERVANQVGEYLPDFIGVGLYRGLRSFGNNHSNTFLLAQRCETGSGAM